MPWSLISQEQATAKDALLLNYLTSTTLGSLFRSIQKHHFPASIGISGSLLLKLLIIFSTGIFGLENRSHVLEKELITLGSLDLANPVEFVQGSQQRLNPPPPPPYISGVLWLTNCLFPMI